MIRLFTGSIRKPVSRALRLLMIPFINPRVPAETVIASLRFFLDYCNVTHGAVNGLLRTMKHVFSERATDMHARRV